MDHNQLALWELEQSAGNLRLRRTLPPPSSGSTVRPSKSPRRSIARTVPVEPLPARTRIPDFPRSAEDAVLLGAFAESFEVFVEGDEAEVEDVDPWRKCSKPS